MLKCCHFTNRLAPNNWARALSVDDDEDDDDDDDAAFFTLRRGVDLDGGSNGVADADNVDLILLNFGGDAFGDFVGFEGDGFVDFESESFDHDDRRSTFQSLRSGPILWRRRPCRGQKSLRKDFRETVVDDVDFHAMNLWRRSSTAKP